MWKQTIKWQCCYSLTWRDTVLVAALLVYTVKLHLDPIETVYQGVCLKTDIKGLGWTDGFG